MSEDDLKPGRWGAAFLVWIIALAVWIFWGWVPALCVAFLSVAVFLAPDETFLDVSDEDNVMTPPLYFRGTKKPGSNSPEYPRKGTGDGNAEEPLSGFAAYRKRKGPVSKKKPRVQFSSNLSVDDVDDISFDDEIERFIYQDAEGHISYKEIEVADRSDDYLEGYYLDTDSRRTFRIDRILETLTEFDDSDERVLHHQENAGPVKEYAPRARRPKLRPRRSRGVVVCFTGFKSAIRDELEATASDAGFLVVKSVTQDLSFLIAGDTAGPAKLSKAEGMGVQILDELEFELMASTGEVPL